MQRAVFACQQARDSHPGSCFRLENYSLSSLYFLSFQKNSAVGGFVADADAALIASNVVLLLLFLINEMISCFVCFYIIFLKLAEK